MQKIPAALKCKVLIETLIFISCSSIAFTLHPICIMYQFFKYICCFLSFLPSFCVFCLFMPLLFLFLFLTGSGLRPRLQCHVSHQDWIGPAAVLSEPDHRGASCAADPGLWGPGSYGHGGFLHFSGGGCRPRRGHASRAGHRHGPHHGKSLQTVSPPQPLSRLPSSHLSSLSLRICATAGEYVMSH